MKSPRKSKVDVHWILAYIDDGSYPLIVDLSKRRRDIATILTPGIPWWDVNVLSRPATKPPVTKLRLISPKTLTIDIVNDQAVTVHDVICHLFETFKRPISPNDLEIFPSEMLREVHLAYHENKRHWTGNSAKIPNQLRWIDALFDEPLFAGLSSDSELNSKYGESEEGTVTLVMNFKPR